MNPANRHFANANQLSAAPNTVLRTGCSGMLPDTALLRTADSQEKIMRSVCGRLSKFLQDSMGNLNGFVLDGGQEVRFWAGYAPDITAIVTLGSQVGIEGELQSDSVEKEYLHATLITNLDSKRTASLPAPVCLGKPGMLSGASTMAASLDHLRVGARKGRLGKDSGAESGPDVLDFYLKKLASHPQPSDHVSDRNVPGPSLPLPRATRHDAAMGIEHAYDGLHRIQAMLAYLKIMKRQIPGISQFLHEAKHTYTQALSAYEAHDFESAREFAAASDNLSQVVETLISRTLRSDTSYPSLVPPPPAHLSPCSDASRVQDDLNEVAAVLSRIHWLLENGTLPLEDRTQARRIVAWGDAIYQQARRMYKQGSQEDAAELAQAANAAARSAEHICRNWYVAQAIHSHDRVIPAQRSPEP